MGTKPAGYIRTASGWSVPSVHCPTCGADLLPDLDAFLDQAGPQKIRATAWECKRCDWRRVDPSPQGGQYSLAVPAVVAVVAFLLWGAR